MGDRINKLVEEMEELGIHSITLLQDSIDIVVAHRNSPPPEEMRFVNFTREESDG